MAKQRSVVHQIKKTASVGAITATATALTVGMAPAVENAAAQNRDVLLTASPNYTQIISDYSDSHNNILFIKGDLGGQAAALWDLLATAIPGGLLPTFTAGTEQVNLTEGLGTLDSYGVLADLIGDVALPVPDLSGVPGLPPGADGILTLALAPGLGVGALALVGPALDTVTTLALVSVAIAAENLVNATTGLNKITGIPTLEDLVPPVPVTQTTFGSTYTWPLLGLGPILGLYGETTISNTFAYAPGLDGDTLVEGLSLLPVGPVDTSAVPNSWPFYLRNASNNLINGIVAGLDGAIGGEETPSVTVWIPTGQGTYGLPLGGSLGWLATMPTLALGPTDGTDTDTVVSTPIVAGGVNLPLNLAELGFATSPGVVFPTATGVSTVGGSSLVSFSIPWLGLGITSANALSATYIGTNGINFNSGQTILTLITPFGSLPIVYSLGSFNAGSTGFGFTLPSLFTVGLLPSFQVGTAPTQQSDDGLIPADGPISLNNGLAGVGGINTPTQLTDLATELGLPDVGALLSSAVLTPLFDALLAPIGAEITDLLNDAVGPLADGAASLKLQLTTALADLLDVDVPSMALSSPSFAGLQANSLPDPLAQTVAISTSNQDDQQQQADDQAASNQQQVDNQATGNQQEVIKETPTPVLDATDDVGDKLADKAPVASTATKTTVELNTVRKAERGKVFSATSEAIKDVVGSATDGDKDTKVVDAVKAGRESVKEARKDAFETVSDAMKDRRTAVREAVKDRLSPTDDDGDDS